MRYQSKIYIDVELYKLIEAGQVHIQCGQWIHFQWCDHPSRWVGLTQAGSLWACHHPIKTNKFATLCENIKRHTTKGE